MLSKIRLFLRTLLIGLIMTSNANAENILDGKDLENIIYLDLKDGRVTIELLPEIAPKHVARIKELAREGFYDGIVFHRVIEGFIAQTGDPTGTGMGGSEKPDLDAEFSDYKHVRGVLSMARSQQPNSANSQFFIVFADAPHLDGQYSAFGKVLDGMNHVDAIKKGHPMSGDIKRPDKIVKMTVAADTN